MDKPQVFANRYIVRSILGEGGMGTVYRVADKLADMREIALKTIKHAGVVTADQRLRFKEEFRAMAQLRHPNTIEVMDFGQLDATSLYITMELVPGRELTEVMANRQMPFNEVYPLLIQLLQALQFIHTRAYVHRDIKSQNVRVRDDGRLKLMDFGLMGQLGQPSSRTVTGSPGYLAPEVAIGGRIDASSDLYSVGCLAFEMIAGRLPFEGSLGQVVRSHISDRAPSLNALRPDVPERLERIVGRMLEKEQSRRYPDAAEVIEDLAALAGLAIAGHDLDQSRSYLTTSRIVGRDEELHMLEGALKGSLAGEGQAVLVAAPAGTGKSRLVQELVLQAKLNEVLVLRGQCVESGMAPYEALALALRPGLAHGTPEERVEHQAALRLLFPTMTREGAADTEPLDGDALATAVLAWLQGLSKRMPLLLLMDDLHWADTQTLAVFNHCVRNMGAHRVLCIGTFRNDETPPGSPVWYTLEEGSALGLTLGPLSFEAQNDLLDAMLPDAMITREFERGLYNATGGNAFFLTEVLHALMEEGLVSYKSGCWIFPAEAQALAPLTSVEETLKRRLKHLSRPARRLANLAAVLGRRQDLAMLQAVTADADDDLFDALDELLQRQFLIKDGDGYTFPHDRVREVLYEQQDATVRRMLHQRAGEYLEAHPGPDAAHQIYELAYHFGNGQDPAKAYVCLAAAAQHADDAGADGTALDLWLRAEAALADADVPDKALSQCRLWLAIGRDSFVLRPHDAISALRKLTHAVESWEGGYPDELAFNLSGIYGLLGTSLAFAGYPKEALVATQRAAELEPSPDPMHVAVRHFQQAGPLLAMGHYDATAAAGNQAEKLFEQFNVLEMPQHVRGPMVGSYSIQNMVAFQGYKPDPEKRDRALETARINGDANPFTVMMAFGIHAVYAGRTEEAIAYLQATVQKCRRACAPPYPFMLYVKAYLFHQRGDFAGALAQVDQALSYAHVQQQRLCMLVLRQLRATALVDLGRNTEARSELLSLLEEGIERGMAQAMMLSRIGLGYEALSRQDSGAAHAVLDAAYRAAQEGPARNPLCQSQAGRLLARVYLLENDTARARRLAEEALAIVERPEIDLPIEQAYAHLMVAEVARAQGDRPAAVAALGRAGDICMRLRNTHWLHGVTRALEDLHQVELNVPAAPAPTPEASVEARWKFVRGAMM